MTDRSIVIDASAVVDLLSGSSSAGWVDSTIRGRSLHAPGHFHAEVLNALGRIHRRGVRSADETSAMLGELGRIPLVVAQGHTLVEGAWRRRDEHSLADALYVELAAQLGTVVVTTDARLARATPLAVAPPE